jgi:hypothetical protein
VGHQKVEAIRSLEPEVVRLEEEQHWFRSIVTGMAGIRGADLYYLSLFGEPSESAPWGFRFDGHHVSASFTVLGSEVSPTPLFLGAQPREVPPGGSASAGSRVLAEEEDRARSLYESLTPAQRERTTLALELDRGLFLGDVRRLAPSGAPSGLPRSALDAGQRAKLDELVDVYLGNVASGIASRERAKIESAGRDAIHFAWAGSTVPGEAVYYRIHGPTVLIEFDNTVDEANHIHTLWRDPQGDYGEDLLRRHHADAHGSP